MLQVRYGLPGHSPKSYWYTKESAAKVAAKSLQGVIQKPAPELDTIYCPMNTKNLEQRTDPAKPFPRRDRGILIHRLGDL